MFFGLTNSLAIFQTIINNILRDLINAGKVASFINNILVGTEEKKEHDEIVEKVVRKLVENNLYVNPEKCQWKVKKVRFLGVVIELERIKMKDEKVKEVLNWLISKKVKDVQKFLRLANYYRQLLETLQSQPGHYITW